MYGKFYRKKTVFNNDSRYSKKIKCNALSREKFVCSGEILVVFCNKCNYF